MGDGSGEGWVFGLIRAFPGGRIVVWLAGYVTLTYFVRSSYIEEYCERGFVRVGESSNDLITEGIG